MPRLKYTSSKYMGKRFGKLTVVSYSHSETFESGYKRVFWNCVCDCGNTTIARSDSLTRGKKRSCGCLINEFNKSKEGKFRTPLGHTALIIAYHKYKDGAKRRGIPFEITREQFKYLVVQDCWYCGEKSSNHIFQKGINGGVFCNGLDRVDSTKGYTADNVVPCCQFCNHAKMEKSESEFVQWLERVRGRPFINLLEMCYANG